MVKLRNVINVEVRLKIKINISFHAGVDCNFGDCRTLRRIPGDLDGDKYFCDCKEDKTSKLKTFRGQNCLGLTPCRLIN